LFYEEAVMYRLLKCIPLAAISALSLSTPAFTQPSPSQQKPAADPNDRVCEDIVQTGSRIAAKRFCGTRSEWEEKKKQDREAVEKAQLNSCMITHTGASGKASC
jgi:hypothetical protein